MAWVGRAPSPSSRGQARAAVRTVSAVSGSPDRRTVPSAPATRDSRSRFSVRVPVLSKQTVSIRPSASSVRGVRTRTPRRLSRRAAASWATVATSGSPSGTAATATDTPPATACRIGAPRSSESPVTAAPPARVSGSALRVSS